MQSIPLTARSDGKIWEKHSNHAEIPQSFTHMRLSLKGSWWQISEGIRADVSYYCTSKSEIPDNKKTREVYPAFKCANESKKRKKWQQECKINNWDASREIYQIISTGKMVSLSPIEIPWTSFRVMKALMNSKCIPVLVLVQLQVNFLLPFALGEEFWTFISQVKIFSLYNIIL